MSREQQSNLQDTARVVSLKNTGDVNQYISVGWVLLSATTSAAPGGYITELYVLGWPAERGEPAYPRDKYERSLLPDAHWASRVAGQLQPDPALKTQQLMAQIGERLQSLVRTLNEFLESESRETVDLHVHHNGLRCVLARGHDDRLTFLIHNGVLVSVIGTVPENPVERPDGAQDVPNARFRRYSGGNLVDGTAYVARRFIERLLEIKEPENDDLSLAEEKSGASRPVEHSDKGVDEYGDLEDFPF